MRRLDASEPGFAAEFDALVNDRRESDSDVSAGVAAIITRVKAEGDAALADYTAKFDRFDLGASGWSISKEECAAAYDALDPKLRDALNLAADRIRAYHAAQLPEDRDYRDATGARLGARWNAVDAAGVYVPGGRAAYPSSVLMNILPAKVAGVGRIVMMTPTPGGETSCSYAQTAGTRRFRATRLLTDAMSRSFSSTATTTCSDGSGRPTRSFARPILSRTRSGA